jgi:hypothetical protein
VQLIPPPRAAKAAGQPAVSGIGGRYHPRRSTLPGPRSLCARERCTERDAAAHVSPLAGRRSVYPTQWYIQSRYRPIEAVHTALIAPVRSGLIAHDRPVFGHDLIR